MTSNPFSRRLPRSAYRPRQFLSRVFRRGIRRKLLCLGVILALLSTPASNVALEQVPVLASSVASTTTDVSASSFGFVSRILRSLFASKPAKPQRDRLVDRLGNVARLRLNPFKYAGFQSETVIFSAVPMDFYGRIVQGAKVNGESADRG